MTAQDWMMDLSQLITKKHVFNVLIALAYLLIGSFLARRASLAVDKLPQLDPQQRLLLGKVTYYGLLFFAIAAGLSQVGIDVKVLIGAAGVLTVAVGFAAQTSASNLISGIFLMGEKPFTVGDVIQVGDFTGEVISIDLLSSKIRMFNNLMVRVPNETLVKSNITNHTYFPIRRVDFKLGVGYDTDIRLLEQILRQVAATHPLCLDDPQPLFLFQGFGDSAMNVMFQVWTLRANMQLLQNELYRDIKQAFDEAGIDLPFPTQTLLMKQSQQGMP